MTTETVLTDADIHDKYQRITGYRSTPPVVLDFARAIEQAVLQSPEIQALRKDAENSVGYAKLLAGAAAILENATESMENGGRDECGAHEARSMAQTIRLALIPSTPTPSAMEQKP